MSGRTSLSRELAKLKKQKEALRNDKKSYSPISFREIMEIYNNREAETLQKISLAVVSYYRFYEDNRVEIISTEFGITKSHVNKILNNYLKKTPNGQLSTNNRTSIFKTRRNEKVHVS